MAKGKKYELYDDTGKQPEVRFEVDKLPLQDQVATVRKAACELWSTTKSQWNEMKAKFTSSVSNVRVKLQDQFRAIGLNNPALVMKVGAVGSAGLVGLMLARRRSLFHRVLYPTLAGGSVWSVIYFSSAENRTHFLNKTKEITSSYQQSVTSYKRKENQAEKETQHQTTETAQKTDSDNKR